MEQYMRVQLKTDVNQVEDYIKQLMEIPIMDISKRICLMVVDF